MTFFRRVKRFVGRSAMFLLTVLCLATVVLWWQGHAAPAALAIAAADTTVLPPAHGRMGLARGKTSDQIETTVKSWWQSCGFRPTFAYRSDPDDPPLYDVRTAS